MTEKGQAGRLLYAVGVGLFGVALAAGVVESVRFDGRLPAIDLLMHGSDAYIHLLIHRKDFAQAIDQLEMQGRMIPLDAQTHELLGKLLGDQGRPEEAREHFKELVRLKPEDADAQGFLGITYMNTDQPDLAAGCFTDAIRLAPQSAKPFMLLGLASARLGKLAEAEKCFSRAVELAPDSVEARTYLDKAREELRAPPDASKKERPRD